MTSEKTAILVADDDVRTLRLMTRVLQLEGYEVLGAPDGSAAMALFEMQAFHLLLLDVMMPGIDGVTLCQRIREFSEVPIIMVTCKSEKEEIVSGLNAGADDYVTKPFSPAELLARVRAVLRRRNVDPEDTTSPFRTDSMVIDFFQRKVTLRGGRVDLTRTQYRMLSYLAHNAGRLLTPDQILEAVWGEDYIGEYHLLRVNIGRLRKKLGDNPKKPRFISTRSGIGYELLKTS